MNIAPLIINLERKIPAMLDRLNSTASLSNEMARLAPILRNLESAVALQTSALHDDIITFRRDNRLIARLYRGKVRKYLAERGWYVGSSLTGNQIAQLAAAIKRCDTNSQIESVVADHVRSGFSAIEESAVRNWPDRAAILADAFCAHRKGQFTLSIPAMLAQADGMAFDVLNAFVFTSRRGSKITEKAAEFIKSDLPHRHLMSSFVGILLEDAGIRTETSDRDGRRQAGRPFSPLNRHGVMHGIDLDYANEANGLRAASLIALLTKVKELKAQPTNGSE